MDKDNKNMKFTINPKRLRYILDLYKLSNEEFLSFLNKDKTRNILTQEDLNQIINQKKEIDISLLKRIDNIFEQGLTWYISKRDLPEKKGSSIFFRKESFNSDLNFESRKVINTFEELKFEIQSLSNFINYDQERKIKQYQVSDNPKRISQEIKVEFNKIESKFIQNNIIQKPRTERDYIKNLIRIIEDFNIFIFEFIDRKRLEEKRISFNGFFINPNIIVIKRQQHYLRRELFTLLHEFAHCLLGVEEIDTKVGEEYINNLNEIEKWCNSFTYNFLIGKYDSNIDNLGYASEENNFHKNKIDELYLKTYLSRSALYTQLRIRNKISSEDYTKIIDEIISSVNNKRRREREQLELEKERLKEIGEKLFIPSPKPIRSKLFEEILKINYFQGNISEISLRNYLKKIGVSSKYFDEVIF